MNRIKVSPNFILSEFECSHCKAVKLSSDLLNKLQDLRNQLGRPIQVNSGYRCPEHNTNVGGAKNSLHLTGKAADISLRNLDIDPIELADFAEEIGFKGIGLYNTFIHLDVRDGRARWSNRS